MHDFHDVLTLHQRFEFPCSEYSQPPSREIFDFRTKFLHEELDEYHVAYGRGNFVGVVDGLLDFVYVCLGTAFFVGTARSGPQANWPTFATARQALVNQGVMDEAWSRPTPLAQAMHLYTCNAMRSYVTSFERSYFAAIEENDGAASLMVAVLKDACDEAYKAAALMHVPWERCWRHVADANLKKKSGPVAKRGNIKWDLSKPCGWVSPDARIATELLLDGWRIPEGMRIDNLTGKVEIVA